MKVYVITKQNKKYVSEVYETVVKNNITGYYCQFDSIPIFTANNTSLDFNKLTDFEKTSINQFRINNHISYIEQILKPAGFVEMFEGVIIASEKDWKFNKLQTVTEHVIVDNYEQINTPKPNTATDLGAGLFELIPYEITLPQADWHYLSSSRVDYVFRNMLRYTDRTALGSKQIGLNNDDDYTKYFDIQPSSTLPYKVAHQDNNNLKFYEAGQQLSSSVYESYNSSGINSQITHLFEYYKLSDIDFQGKIISNLKFDFAPDVVLPFNMKFFIHVSQNNIDFFDVGWSTGIKNVTAAAGTQPIEIDFGDVSGLNLETYKYLSIYAWIQASPTTNYQTNILMNIPSGLNLKAQLV